MTNEWQARLKNPHFWIEIAVAVLVPVFSYFGLSGPDVTSWSVFFLTLKDALLNPWVLLLAAVSVCNTINNPTTKGFLLDGEAIKGGSDDNSH